MPAIILIKALYTAILLIIKIPFEQNRPSAGKSLKYGFAESIEKREPNNTTYTAAAQEPGNIASLYSLINT